MDQQFQNELEATKASFYKLQDNFNHNLRVISQLEQDNQKLLEENQNLRAHYHKQIDELHGAVQRLRNQNSKLSSMIKNEVMKTRAACEQQTQHIIEMMNQKMMEQKRYEAQKYARQKKEAQSEIQKLQQSLRHYTIQNSKLLQTIKQQRNQKDTIQTELSSLLSQKQAYANKFNLHQKELENLRASNEEWQNILKDKVKEANKEKQKAEEQLSEAKLSFKLKLKGLKDETSKKIEEIEESKEKSIRLLTQQARQIKFRFDTNFQQLQKLRAEAKTYQKQKQRLQQNIEQLSKQANSQKQIQYMKKMQQQERIQLKNEIKMLQNEKNQIKEQLKQTNQRRQQVQKTVERLKTGLIAAQKDVGESQKRNKKMEREIKELRNQIKRLSENGNINLRGFNITKMENQDGVNQNGHQNQGNMDYSKYFSEDMGPADQMFFMQNSIPKSPKNAQLQSAPSQVNHQLLKKIGQLQVQTDQYKNIIKTMTDDLQKIKTNLTDQIIIKQQQIKLNRDQIYLLRQKINQRQQQLLSLNSLRQQLQEKNKKINQGSQKVNQLFKEVDMKRGQNKRLEEELGVMRGKFGEMEEKLGNVEEEKRILEEINEELRGEIHQFKNRIRLYNQSEEQSGSDEYFQEIRFDQSSSIEQKMKKSTQIKKKSRSRSKSGNKNRPTPPAHQHQHQGSTTSMKLRDLVLKKKQLEMQGKKMNIEYKQTNPNRNIEKAGTQSQKQILETMKRRSKSKSKGKQRAERLKNLDYDRLMGRRDQNDAEND